MNYLDLCQAVIREGGISGAITSVTSQTGEMLRVVNWVAQAYRDLMNMHSEWTFLRTDVQFDTTSSNSQYTAAAAGVAEFGEWRFRDDWRCYLKSSGVANEQPIPYMNYNEFRRRYLFSTNRTATNRPLVVTEKPDQSLLFWPIPDNTYTIVGEQYRSPVSLVNNTDIPTFPVKFHYAIVHLALMKYAEWEGDAGKFSAAQNDAKTMVGKMEDLYLPEWDDPETLA